MGSPVRAAPRRRPWVTAAVEMSKTSGGPSPQLWRRYLPSLLAGLRPDGPTLPVPALTDAELAQALQRPRSLARNPRS